MFRLYCVSIRTLVWEVELFGYGSILLFFIGYYYVPCCVKNMRNKNIEVSQLNLLSGFLLLKINLLFHYDYQG